MNNAGACTAVPSQKCISAEWQEYHTEDRQSISQQMNTGRALFLCQRHPRCLILVSFRTIIQLRNNRTESPLTGNGFILMQSGLSHLEVIDLASFFIWPRELDANINKPQT